MFDENSLKLYRILAIGLFLLVAENIAAQHFGGNPASLKWKQVNSATARIIFPSGLEAEAMDISEIIHELAKLSLKTIGNKTEKINIVLQNQGILSNGYVGLGPYRSEFLLTPRQNNFELGSLPWHKTLALHEYRHVQQFNNFRRGLSRGLYYLFGEQGQAFANSVAVPDWFFEGDAVYQETLFSRQGRGRIPYFFNPYRSLWSSGKEYSWMKLRNGSYQDMVPDHYRLGYMLVSYGREKSGSEVWRKITGDAAAFKGLFYPFQKAFRRHTGDEYNQFREAAMHSFRDQTDHKKDTAVAFAEKHKHFAGNEEFPQWMNDSTIAYVKSSYKNIPAFYSRNTITGEEKKIRVKDISPDDYFSYRNGKIVYAAFKPDPRREWRNYGTINIVDTKTGDQSILTRKTKYFSPDISSDGTKVIAVYFNPSGNNALHLLDANTGEQISEMPNPEKFIFTQPKFYGTDSVVSAVRNTSGEMAIALFHIPDGRYSVLTPFTFNVIGWPQVENDTIHFTMSYKGRDQLFSLIGGETFLFQPEWENLSTGNYHLASRNGQYSWMMFTAAGFHSINGKGRLLPINIEPDKQPKAGLMFDSTHYDQPVSKYRKSFRPFNFHSWRPYISDPEYSWSLIGENILNTFQSELFVTYNRNERFKQTGASFAYGGWFPIISAGASYTFDRSFTDSAGEINWNEFNTNAGISIPLTFNHGTYSQHLNIGTLFNSKKVIYTGPSKYTDKQFNYADLRFSFTNQQIKAVQNIYPAIAQTIAIRHRFVLNNYTARQFMSSGAFYFPGFFTNHSIVLQGSYQFRDTLQQYNFSNTFSLSRGYNNLNFPQMWKAGINYHFPIVYPDIGFANILYLLRVRGNVFYDHTGIKSMRTGEQFSFRSAGMEIYFDTKWWNQLPVSFGIRYSRLFDGEILGLNPNQWELVLPLTLLSD